MIEKFSPGDPVLFMKIGTHANEELADIIERKKMEIKKAGFAMWGYGGNTCHPSTMVRPFASTHASAGRSILLCMHPMQSRHFAENIRAEEFSTDGIDWKPVPKDINVLGSRYALCISNLEEVQSTLSLADTKVAVGRSKGKRGSDYIKGRVDKACLEIVAPTDESKDIEIGLVAQVIEPYAVFLRN